jgi:MFS family permease
MDSSSLKGKKPLAARLPFYYGWVMVAVAMIATAVTGVGQTYGISVINPSLMDSLDISLSALSAAYMAGTLLAALPQPYIGSLMDRFGIRRTMLAVVLLLGAACLFFTRVDSLATLLIGFFLLRLLGQGGLSLLAGNISPMWFRDKLGTAAGIVSGSFSVSNAVVPALFLSLLNRFGWRGTYSRLGGLVWLIMLPILLLVFRDKPAEVGQEMDGRKQKSATKQDLRVEAEYSFPVKEARRTPAYWIMLISGSLFAMIVTAVFFNLLSIFDELGIPPQVATATYSTFAGVSLSTQLLLGRLANKGPLHYLLLISLSLLAGSIAVLTAATTPWIAHAYAVLLGISAGLFSLVGGTMFARYFGRAHLGKLNGSVVTAQVAASSLGPLITGLVFDLTGSFQISLWLFVGILVPAAVFSLKALPPSFPGNLEEHLNA